MYIHEAVKKAMEERKGIKRKSDRDNGVNICRYWNGSFEGIFREGGETIRLMNWSPTAEDLTADDWEVVEA